MSTVEPLTRSPITFAYNNIRERNLGQTIHKNKSDNTLELGRAEKKVIAELEKRDSEVKTHEQKHKASGGSYTGGITYQYEKGPDGKLYAVSGHTDIDISEESTPEKTIQKMQTVRKAALAPSDPSQEDRKVAAQAAAKEEEARRKLIDEKAVAANENMELSENLSIGLLLDHLI